MKALGNGGFTFFAIILKIFLKPIDKRTKVRYNTLIHMEVTYDYC